MNTQSSDIISILFIAPTIQDYQSLIVDLAPDIQVVLLDAEKDGSILVTGIDELKVGSVVSTYKLTPARDTTTEKVTWTALCSNTELC